MDLKLMRKELKGGRRIVCERVEQAIDSEFSLPDYCPDIEKILKCTVRPAVSGVSKNGSSVTVDIICYITLLYCPADLSHLKGYEIAVNYTKVINSAADLSDCYLTADITADYMNCRAVNERKLEIHGAATMNVYAECRASVDVVSDSEAQHLQLRRCTQPSTELCTGVDKLYTVNEEMELPSTGGMLTNIVKYTANAVYEDCKTVANKAIVKGQLCVCILYCTDEGRYEHLNASYPINQILDLDGVGEDSSIHVRMSVAGCEIKPYTNTDGECRSILLSAKLLITAAGYNKSQIECVCDSYSTENELNITRSAELLRQLCCELNIDHNIKQSVTLMDNAVSEVLDISCERASALCSYEDSELTISGEVIVHILTRNEDGQCMFFEKSLPYEHKMAVVCTGRVVCEIKAYIKSSSYNILNSSDVEMRVQLAICGEVFCEQQAEVVTDISVDEQAAKQKQDMPTLVVFYAKSGDSVWNIARRYNTSADVLMQHNELQNDILDKDRMLLIPGV